METDKDCINCEDGQLDDDSLASVWGGSRPVIKWIGKEIARAAISEVVSSAVQGLLNRPPTTTGPFSGQVTGGGYGGGGSGSW